MSKPTIFISHITQEKEIACVIKSFIEEKFLGIVDVFVSSHEESLKLGDDWMSTIKNSMIDCTMIIVICSPISITRPWINFESGAGWIKGTPVIPLCHSGLSPGKLPVPLNSFQGGILNKKEDIEKLFNRIASVLEMKPPNSNDNSFFLAISEFESVIEKSAISKHTIFINNLLSRQINLLKYAIHASTKDYEYLQNIDLNNINISDYNYTFNDISFLFNISLLMTHANKKVYEVFYYNANKLADNAKFILSYNNIEIAPDIKDLLNIIIFIVAKNDDWFDIISRTDKQPTTQLKDVMIEMITSAEIPPERKFSNAINNYIDYYETLISFHKWIVHYENVVNSLVVTNNQTIVE